MTSEIVLALLVGMSIGFTAGFWVAAHWAGEVLGKNLARLVDSGRLTKEQAAQLIDVLLKR